MKENTVRLTAEGFTTKADWTSVVWKLQGLGLEDFRLSHSVPEHDQDLLGEPHRGDHALCATLLKAMEQGHRIQVEGRVSPTLLEGLEDLQAIWHRWRPDRYRPIEIAAEEESEAAPVAGERPAVFAFSGGVDASYSLFRHLKGQAGRANRKPGAAVLVHGMDIPLDREDFYDRAAARAQRMLDGTPVRLIRMRTNSRALGQDWEDGFGLQLIGCFLLLQATFANAVKGSEEPYDALMLPWGSTPLTDPLCSTATMAIRHDGCDAGRTEKVRWLATQTQVVEHLRVCWEGSELDRNCGECEKCIRTMLNFWATNLPIPSAFPTELTPERVASIRIRNPVQLSYLVEILRFAEHHHPKGDPILRAVQRRLGYIGPKAFVRRAVRRTVDYLKI